MYIFIYRNPHIAVETALKIHLFLLLRSALERLYTGASVIRERYAAVILFNLRNVSLKFTVIGLSIRDKPLARLRRRC